MLSLTRTLIVGSCLAVIAAGCGGGPTSPSGRSGATIAGTVQVTGGAALAPGSSAASGLTVSIVGTSLNAAVESSGYFQIPGAPSGTIQLLFRDAVVNATVQISNVGSNQLVEIVVQVSGTSATVVSEERTESKVTMCHRTESGETGSYHSISVSANAEPAHRAHGDGKVGDKVPASPTQVFDQNCQPSGPAVQLVKSTNGEDANNAPGPTILVGNTVTWTYVVTNTGTVPLTNVVVTDDRGVTVTCPGTTLAVGQSMTCTATGVAVEGQYRNVGTATASSTTASVTDTDPSHYFGRLPDDDGDGPKVQLCHRTGAGFYVLISVGVSAEPAHRAHGDGKVGEAVPGSPGKVFGSGCSVN
jgi:uncharacterized repeat protein (TIGR01451 family)